MTETPPTFRDGTKPNTPEATAYLEKSGWYACYCADGTFLGRTATAADALATYDCTVRESPNRFGDGQTMGSKRGVTITLCESILAGKRVFIVQSMLNSIEFYIGDTLYPCDVEELLRTNKYTLKIVGSTPIIETNGGTDNA